MVGDRSAWVHRGSNPDEEEPMALARKKSRTDDVSDPAKLLIADHEKVERIFAEIEGAESDAQRSGLAAQLIKELTDHTELEETIVYPFIRANVPDGPALIDDANHEHGEARQLMAKLSATSETPDFDKVVADLKKAVQHHVKDEEKRIFPKLASAVGEDRLGYLRGDLERAKFGAFERPTAGGSPTSTSTGGDTAGTAVWVQPHHVQDGRWQVRREGASRASRVFDTQREATEFGRRVAAREKVELLIAGRDGEIRIKDSAGR
jgi:hemerythrin superfamily protein